jgi:SAM-dependent methyltransferase
MRALDVMFEAYAMARIIGAVHEFHEAGYARDWAARFDPTPERLRLFAMIIGQLKSRPLPMPHVVELGIGPGYLAAGLLDAITGVTYEGVDFSQPMLEIAAARLNGFSERVTFTQANLVVDPWDEWVKPPGAVVSTWTLHDLGSEANTATVYQRCKSVLPPGGMLVNADFIKPNGTKFEYEPGRFSVERHVDILSSLGFESVECVGIFELELEAPTPAQNYACFKAIA